jgi:transposase
MDECVWKVIRIAIRSAVRSIPRTGRRPRYRDELIVKMFFWSVAHDRPLCWACRRRSYNAIMRPRHLPSVSQFCKRLKEPHIEAIIRRIHELLAGLDEPVTLAYIDGKALPVSESSKDPDARKGYGNGRFSRGYKLHALGDLYGRIRAFFIRPLNEGEPPIAREHLVKHISPGALVLADGNYDGRALYTLIGEGGAFLLTPQKKNKRTEAALRKTSPERRAAIEFWRDEPKLAWKIYGLRSGIERIFSALSCYGGGLGPLPAWVRRLGRVDRWVTAKVALYNARVLLRMDPS